MVSRGIQDVRPNRQRQLASKRAAINLLRLIEACPNGTSEIGIIPGKQRIGKIVRGAGFTCGRTFLQTKFRESSFSCSCFKRVCETGMHFVRGFRFGDELPDTLPFRVPNQSSVLFLDALQNMRHVWSPSAVWEYRVRKSEFGQSNLAAPEKRSGIRTKRGMNSRRSAKLQHRINSRIHPNSDACAIF